VKITQRLEGRARTVARAARDLGRGSASGPQAVYARVLDGERLWLALEAGVGEPALRRVDTGEIVQPVDDLPPGQADHEPGFRSVRWLLTTVVPEADGAEVEVVVLPEGGGAPQRLLGPGPHPETPGRADTTPDGRWRFVLDVEPGLVLRVRRTAIAPAARLLSVSTARGAVTIECERAGRDQADLLLVDSDGRVATRLPTTPTERGVSRTISHADLPASGGYRVAVGAPDDFVPVWRWHTDLHLPDPTNVLLPMLTDESGDRVSARLRFAAGGALRLQRVDLEAKDDA
jgi:hypothetical protein